MRLNLKQVEDLFPSYKTYESDPAKHFGIEKSTKVAKDLKGFDFSLLDLSSFLKDIRKQHIAPALDIFKQFVADHTKLKDKKLYDEFSSHAVKARDAIEARSKQLKVIRDKINSVLRNLVNLKNSIPNLKESFLLSIGIDPKLIKLLPEEQQAEIIFQKMKTWGFSRSDVEAFAQEVKDNYPEDVIKLISEKLEKTMKPLGSGVDPMRSWTAALQGKAFDW